MTAKVHRISSDTMMLFGKYKGQAVSEILTKDVGYFYWLTCAGAATLDEDILALVQEWVRINPAVATKTRHAAEKFARERDEKSGPPTVKKDNDPTPYVPPAPMSKAIEAQYATNWGSW